MPRPLAVVTGASSGIGFELANRSRTRANAVHVRRFDALCRMLAERRELLPTAHFADRPALGWMVTSLLWGIALALPLMAVIKVMLDQIYVEEVLGEAPGR